MACSNRFCEWLVCNDRRRETEIEVRHRCYLRCFDGRGRGACIFMGLWDGSRAGGCSLAKEEKRERNMGVTVVVLGFFFFIFGMFYDAGIDVVIITRKESLLS